MNVYFGVIFAVLTLVPANCERIPVLIWGTESNEVELPSVSSLNTVSLNEFSEDYVKPLIQNSYPFLIFLQDSLSLEDFTLYGNAYGSTSRSSFENLQNAIPSDKPSLFLQSVESPAKALSSLPASEKTLTLEDGHYSTDGKEDYRVVLVKLPETKGSQDRKASLSENDKIIGSVLKEVSAKFPQYRAMFTGQQPSWLSFENTEKNRVARHLLSNEISANNTAKSVITASNCFIMATKSLGYSLSTGNDSATVDKPVPLGRPTDIEATCGSKVELSYQEAGNVTDLKILFNFQEFAGDWYLVVVNVSYTRDGSSHNGYKNVYDIWAPRTWSYSCASKYIIVPMDSPTSSYFYLALSEWQIQQGNSTFYSFGQSYDCVGFFTIPIWMGIIVVGIMLIILFTAIFALTTIKTMDRFDDPKGKGLTITTTD